MRPAKGAPVIHACVRVPGINDDFNGGGPDIGAYEAGRELMLYGPRSGPYLDRLKRMQEGKYTPQFARTEEESE